MKFGRCKDEEEDDGVHSVTLGSWSILKAILLDGFTHV